MYFTSGKDLLQKNKGHNMQNNELLVSVILICKNNKDLIRRPIDSVFEQNYKNIEIVVVDSSNDETINILEEYKSRSPFPFRIIHQEPKGVGIARNTGIENAKGEVVAFVDADCWIDKDFIEKIVKQFSESDKVLSVYTDKIQVTPTGIFPQIVDLYERVMHYNDGIKVKSEKLNTYVVRKNLYDLIGFYNPNLKSGEDVELFNRLLKKKESLLKQGFKFAKVLDTNFYEEKQGLGVFEYYKRCIWYGKPLANFDYFKSDLTKNSVKLFFATYYTILLPFVTFSIFINLEYLFILFVLIPFIGIYIYIILKSISIKKFNWIVFLMPILLFYKFIGLFVGFMEAILKL